MSWNYIFDKALAQFERGFLKWNNNLMLNCELKEMYLTLFKKQKTKQNKTKSHGSLTRENSWKVAVNMTYPICLMETACTQQCPTINNVNTTTEHA